MEVHFKPVRTFLIISFKEDTKLNMLSRRFIHNKDSFFYDLFSPKILDLKKRIYAEYKNKKLKIKYYTKEYLEE